MHFGHESLDVYQVSIRYVGWAYRQAMALDTAHRHARDQWLRAAQSIPLNIAEGNGKGTSADRRKFFEIARGSALECAAIQDLLVVCDGLQKLLSDEGKSSLIRIVSMLTKLSGSDSSLREEPSSYSTQ
jgi:four helix bundle protein